MAIFASSSVPGLVANIVGAWLLLFLINAPAAKLGLRFDEEAPPEVWLSPPGWLVVLAWLLLFPVMGAARWLVLGAHSPSSEGTALLIVVLAIVCASYAYYTLLPAKLTGVSPAVFGLIGNLVVIALSVWIVRETHPIAPLAAVLLAGVPVWTALATVSVVQLVWKGA